MQKWTANADAEAGDSSDSILILRLDGHLSPDTVYVPTPLTLPAPDLLQPAPVVLAQSKVVGNTSVFSPTCLPYLTLPIAGILKATWPERS